MTEEEQDTAYRKGLELTKMYGPYVLQRRDPKTGEWRNVHLDADGGVDIRGYEAATKILEDWKREERGAFRVLPKPEADKFREGVNVGKALAGIEKRQRRRHRHSRASRIPSGMYMPEHL